MKGVEMAEQELRKVLYDTMHDLMSAHDDIVIVGADLNKSDGFYDLRNDFPDRILNVGIAEQNMACVAAGMASYGMTPFINTFCVFASRRICDQIAISISYAERNVKIIGTDPGIASEQNGGTHTALEDIGVLRSIPNMVIVEPADSIELRQMVRAIYEYKGPVYMRLYRKIIDDVHDDQYDYELGKADIIKEGSDITIISSGIMTIEAVRAAEQLMDMHGIDAEVINMHTIKPIDAESIVRSARKTGVIVTAENHNVIGGLRSAVAEVITELFPVHIFPVGINNIKGEVGLLSELRERFKLRSCDIVETAKLAMNHKIE